MSAPKVMSWNVQSPESRTKINQVARKIAGAKPNIVGLQEVCNQQMEAIVRRLRRRYELRYRKRPGTVSVQDGACGPYGSRFGQAILSLKKFRNHVNRCWWGPRCPAPAGGDESRGWMAVTTRIAGREVRVFNTHLGLWRHCRQRKASRSLARKARAHRRAIVIGDFNVRPSQRTERRCGASRKRVMGPMYSSMTEVDPSKRTTKPGTGKLDYVFLRGLRRRGARTLARGPSDHRPLIGRISR